jgi:hypothetical protein
MAKVRAVSFRSQITGTISDLIHDEGLDCKPSQDFLCALVGELLRYHDEGIELNPTIIFMADANQIHGRFPRAVRYSIGEADISPSSVKTILKGCAPLARGSWCIVIERTKGKTAKLKYGVFDYPMLPSTLPIADAMALKTDEFCMLITKTSPGTIEIRGARGSLLTMLFSTTREDSPTHDDPIGDFAKDCCAQIAEPPEPGPQFIDYFRRLLEQVLTESHGTIFLCMPSENLGKLAELKDGISLTPKLDFFAAFTEYQQSSSAESLMKLQSCEKLLSGLVMCDGTVVFDHCGSVIAYRVFYRPSSPRSKEAEISDGGARRRAFEGIKKLLGEELTSALFRSQDGLTISARNKAK